MPDQATRSRIMEEPINLGTSIASVDGNRDDAQPVDLHSGSRDAEAPR